MASDEMDGSNGSRVTVVDVTGRADETKPPASSSLRPGGGQEQGGTEANPRWRVIGARRHPVYVARVTQLHINLLALAGGAPYVRERLSRFAGECKVDWEGGSRADGTPVTGRRDQAHCMPYPSRIAAKISQYVFAQQAAREGGDATLLADITRDGESVGQFMRRVNDMLTACRWCWIGVDSPQFDAENTNLEQRATQKLRPYWTLYAPTDVVDWKIRDDGTILWLLTEGEEYRAGDPYVAPSTVRVRNLWEPGVRTRFEYKDGRITKQQVFPFALKRVPFVLVGTASADPWLFDSIEGINRTIMDLESCSRQNFFERVFPQMYLPSGAVAAAARVWNVSEAQAAEMIVGLSYPILVDKDDALPGYVQANAADLAQVDVKTDKLREAMFECVGLMLRQESRSAQSGESKAWDHLDAEQVLADRAALLEEAEGKVAVLTNEWDRGVAKWQPRYSRQFDVTDFAAGIAAVVQGAQVSQPPELARLGLRVLYQMYRKLNRLGLTPEQEREITEAIDEFDAAAGGAGPMEEVGGGESPEERLEREEAERSVEEKRVAEAAADKERLVRAAAAKGA